MINIRVTDDFVQRTFQRSEVINVCDALYNDYSYDGLLWIYLDCENRKLLHLARQSGFIAKRSASLFHVATPRPDAITFISKQ